MTVRFIPGTAKIWCALNISNDCVGMLDLDDCHEDEDGQVWNVCRPCAEHERISVERLRKMRRDTPE